MYTSVYSLSKNKVVYLAIAIWLHITLLDLFYVSLSGPLFFWAESVELKTLATHLFITLITVMTYLLLHRARLDFQKGNRRNGKVFFIFIFAVLLLATLFFKY